MNAGHAEAPQATGGWAGPLTAIILLQTAAAFLLQLLPVMAPLLAARFAWPESAIGYLMAGTMAAAIFCLSASSPLVRGLGPVRAVQTALLVGALGAALLWLPFWGAPLVACLLIGLAYGPATPAGGEVLQRFAPARHRSLVFSIKQAGVPLGGAAAGVLLPAVAARGGLEAAVGVALAVLLATVALAQLFRGRVDERRDRTLRWRPGLFLTTRNLGLPLRALRARPGLLRLAAVGGGLACCQGTLNAFLVTYLVAGQGRELAAAGTAFALLQAGGVGGRLLLGWLADRLGSALTVLRGAALASVAAMLALAAAGPELPQLLLLALAGLAGASVAGWNGVHLGEIARRAPGGQVGEASAGAAMLAFVGLVVGPALFATVLQAGGGFVAGLAVLALVPAAAFLFSLRLPEAPGPAAQSTGSA